MAGKVKIPGVGEVPKAGAIAGAAVLAGILGYAYWRHSRTAASSGAVTSAASATGAAYTGYGAGDPYPPDGTSGNPSDPYSLDPASGMTYGDEGAGSYAGAGYGYYGSGSPGGGYPTAPGGYSTNAQWAQAAEDYLVNSTGADATTVAAALGKYLTGGAITPDQQVIVNSAIAFEGFPPVSGPNGYPPSMQVSQPSGGGGGGGGGGAVNPVSGLHASARDTQIDVSWSASAGATGYQLTAMDGSKVIDQRTTTATRATVFHLKRKTHYTISVLAQPAASGAAPATVSATTK